MPYSDIQTSNPWSATPVTIKGEPQEEFNMPNYADQSDKMDSIVAKITHQKAPEESDIEQTEDTELISLLEDAPAVEPDSDLAHMLDLAPTVKDDRDTEYELQKYQAEAINVDADPVARRSAVKAMFDLDPSRIPQNDWEKYFTVTDPTKVTAEEFDKLEKDSHFWVNSKTAPSLISEWTGGIIGTDPREGFIKTIQFYKMSGKFDELSDYVHKNGSVMMSQMYLNAQGKYMYESIKEARKNGEGVEFGILKARSYLSGVNKVAKADAEKLAKFMTIGGDKNKGLQYGEFQFLASMPARILGITYESVASFANNLGGGIVGAYALITDDDVLQAKINAPTTIELTDTKAEKNYYDTLKTTQTMVAHALVPEWASQNKHLDELNYFVSKGGAEFTKGALNMAMELTIFGGLTGVGYAKPLVGDAIYTASFKEFGKASLFHSSQFALWKALTTKGSSEERVQTALTTMMFFNTPTFSRMAPKVADKFMIFSDSARNSIAVLTDIGLNMGLTQTMTDMTYTQAYQQGMHDAQAKGEPPVMGMLYGLINATAMLPFDAVPSMSTKAMGRSVNNSLKYGAKKQGFGTVDDYKSAINEVAKDDIYFEHMMVDPTKPVYYENPIDDKFPNVQTVKNQNEKVLGIINGEESQEVRGIIEDITDKLNERYGQDTPVEIALTTAPRFLNPQSEIGRQAMLDHGFSKEEIDEYGKNGQGLKTYAWLDTFIDRSTGKKRFRINLTLSRESFGVDPKTGDPIPIQDGQVAGRGLATTNQETYHEVGHMLGYLGFLKDTLLSEQGADMFASMVHAKGGLTHGDLRAVENNTSLSHVARQMGLPVSSKSIWTDSEETTTGKYKLEADIKSQSEIVQSAWNNGKEGGIGSLGLTNKPPVKNMFKEKEDHTGVTIALEKIKAERAMKEAEVKYVPVDDTKGGVIPQAKEIESGKVNFDTYFNKINNAIIMTSEKWKAWNKMDIIQKREITNVKKDGEIASVLNKDLEVAEKEKYYLSLDPAPDAPTKARLAELDKQISDLSKRLDKLFSNERDRALFDHAHNGKELNFNVVNSERGTVSRWESEKPAPEVKTKEAELPDMYEASFHTPITSERIVYHNDPNHIRADNYINWNNAKEFQYRINYEKDLRDKTKDLRIGLEELRVQKFQTNKFEWETIHADPMNENGVVTLQTFSIRTLEPTIQELKEYNATTKILPPEVLDKYIKDVRNVASLGERAKIFSGDQIDQIKEFRKGGKYYDNRLKFIKPNADQYGVSADASTLCLRRMKMQATIDAVQRAVGFPLNVNDMYKVYESMKPTNQVGCGICYVDTRRMNAWSTVMYKALLGHKRGEYKTANRKPIKLSKEMRDLFKRSKDVNEGYKDDDLKRLKAEDKKAYESLASLLERGGYDIENYVPSKNILYYNNKLGKFVLAPESVKKLKIKDDDIDNMMSLDWITKEFPSQYPEEYKKFKKLFAGTQIKVPEARAEYFNDVLDHFSDPKTVEDVNAIGGMRTFSWSDFMLEHTIDFMQIIADASAKGLMKMSYTKIPDYVNIFGRTNEMINMSIIGEPKGVDKNGQIAIREDESFPNAMQVRDEYDHVGTVYIAMKDNAIEQAMNNPNIDNIIPYHKSGMNKIGLKATENEGANDYTQVEGYMQPTFNKKQVAEIEKEISNLKQNGVSPREIWERVILSRALENPHGVVKNLNDPIKGEQGVAYWKKHKTEHLIFKQINDSKSIENTMNNFYNWLLEKKLVPPFYQYRSGGGQVKNVNTEGWSKEMIDFLGYEKFIADFRVWDRTGNRIEQKVVTPNFNMEAVQEAIYKYESPDYSPHMPTVNKMVDEINTRKGRLHPEEVKKLTDKTKAFQLTNKQIADIANGEYSKFSIRDPKTPTNLEYDTERFVFDTVYKPNQSPKMTWRMMRAWRGMDGMTHVGEPSGMLGDIRKSMSREDRLNESPEETLKRISGLEAQSQKESDYVANPLLAGVDEDGRINPARVADTAQRFADAYDLEFRDRPDIKKLTELDMNIDRGSIRFNKAKSSMYAKIADFDGEIFNIRVSDHAPSKGRLADKYPYEIDVRVPKGKVEDPKAIAEAINESFMESLHKAKGNRNATQISRGLDEAGVPDEKDGIINKLRNVFGFEETDPIKPLSNTKDKLNASQVPPQHLLRLMGNDASFDITKEGALSSFHHHAVTAKNKEMSLFFAGKDIIDKASEGLDKKRWGSRKLSDMTKFQFKDDKGKAQTVNLNDSEIMSIYMASKDSDNLRHLKEHGFIKSTQRKKGKAQIVNDELIEQVNAVVESDKGLKRFSEGLRATLDHYQGAGNFASLRTIGKRIMDKLNYYPILVATEKIATKLSAMSEIRDLSKIQKTMDILHKTDFLKKRDEKGGGPVVLQDPIDLINRYGEMLSRYAGWVEYLTKAKATTNSPIFKETMNMKYSKAYSGMIDSYIKDLETGGRPEPQSPAMKSINKVGNFFVDKFISGKLKWNAKVAVMQIASYYNARPYIPAKHWYKANPTGLLKGLNNKLLEEMKASNAILRGRYETNQSMAGEFRSDKYGRSAWGWKGIEAGDRNAVGRIYTACKSWVKEEHPDWSEKQIQVEAGDRTVRVISYSQPSQHVMDRPELARSNNALLRGLLVMFTSQRNMNHGTQMLLGKDTYAKFKSGAYLRDPSLLAKDSERLITTVGVPTILISALSYGGMQSVLAMLEAFDIYYDETKEDGWEEDALWSLASTVMGDRGMIASKLFSVYQGYSTNLPIQQIWQEWGQMLEAWSDYSDVQGKRYGTNSKYGFRGQRKDTHAMNNALYKSAKVVNDTTGLGIMNLFRDVTGVYNLATGQYDNNPAHRRARAEAKRKKLRGK